MLKKILAAVLIAGGFLFGVPAVAGATLIDWGWAPGSAGSAHCTYETSNSTINCDTVHNNGTWTIRAFSATTPSAKMSTFIAGGGPGDPFAVYFCGRYYTIDYNYAVPTGTWMGILNGRYYHHVRTQRYIDVAWEAPVIEPAPYSYNMIATSTLNPTTTEGAGLNCNIPGHTPYVAAAYELI